MRSQVATLTQVISDHFIDAKTGEVRLDVPQEDVILAQETVKSVSENYSNILNTLRQEKKMLEEFDTERQQFKQELEKDEFYHTYADKPLLKAFFGL